MAEYKYKTIIWLAAKVFLDRDFVSDLDTRGIDAVIAECPLGNDLTPEQHRTFMQTFSNFWMRLLVKLWWVVYDILRKRGTISAASVEAAPWEP